jgi:hypothetical protein
MPGIDTGTHNIDYYTPTVHQPKLQKPNNSSFKLWKQVLDTFATTNKYKTKTPPPTMDKRSQQIRKMAIQ